MSDSLYVNDNGTPVPLNLGTGPEYVQRIEALEGDVSTLNTFKASQSTRDAQQDAAISAAQTEASNAINGAVTSAVIDGLDLVLTYGNGTTKRVSLPTGKGVGDMWFGVDPKSKPANVQAYSGQLLSRSAYPAHWAFVNGGNRTVISESQWQAQVSANGFCPYYSSGDGSTTYRMPSLKGVHPKFVAALAEAGGYTAAGLPNITGAGVDACDSDANTTSSTVAGYGTSGALTVSPSGSTRIGFAYAAVRSYTNQARTTFDASRSNPIYGASTTVQPPAVNIILGEYVVGAVAALGEANATSLLASVTRLESGVGALENGVGRAKAYITETWSSGTSWYRKWSDGWLEQGGKTTERAWTTITLPKAFSNTNYTVVNGGGDGNDGSWPCSKIISATQIAVGSRGTVGYYSGTWYYVCGY